ncbi:MAG: NADH-quinone oxidoreductase subunit H [Phycisphaerae bacterium]
MGQIMNFDRSDKTPTVVDRLIRAPAVLIGGAVALLLLIVVVLLLIWWLWGDAVRALLASQLGFSIVVMAISVGLILTMTAVCILAERKISAFIQDRKGPNRVGFWGVVQPAADGLKFLLKEEFTPANVDRPIFILAPCIAFVIAFVGFAIIPWAGEIQWPWMVQGTVTTQVASLDIGILYVIAVGGLGVYGVVLAGWASNCKYSFYGGMRSAAQMISYEVPLGLVLVVLLLVAGTLRPEIIVNQQAQSGIWNAFLHPIAFLLIATTAFAEANRTPFDLAEAEQELVGGFHTEYSSMKFAMFFLGEYAHMVTAGAVIVALFLGGWHVWFLPNVENTTWWAALIKFAVYWVKIILFLGFYMLIRWTLPRFRFDQLMRLAWTSMIPLAMGLLVAQGVLVAFGCRVDPNAGFWNKLGVVLIYWIANAAVLALALWVAGRSKQPVTGRQDNLPEIEVRPRATT